MAVLARRAPWRWRSSVLAHEREGLASVERLIGVRDALGTQIGPVGLLLRRDVSDEIADGLDRWQESLGITEGAQAAATIRRGLSEDDAHTRSHALEALEAVRSPELARLAARLLAPPRATEPPDATCARHPPAGGMPSSEALTRGAGRWRMALVAAAAAEQGRSGVDCSTASHDGKDSLMLSLIERATLLRGVPPFADLPSDQLRLLAEVTEEIEVARGETLIAAGTGGEHLYVVIAGQVALEEARGAGGSVARIGTVGPGAALGEDAVFDGGAHVVNATAITDCRMLSLQRDDLLARIEEHPSLAQALIAWLSLRLRETSGKLAERTRARPRSVINLLDQLGDDAK